MINQLTKYRTAEQAREEIRNLTALHKVPQYVPQIVHRCEKKTAVATCCRSNEYPRIEFVEFYALHLTDYDFRQIVLHEIAHALTPFHGHDQYFRSVCRRIGGIETARLDLSYLNDFLPPHLSRNKLERKYIYVCPNGHEHKKARLLNRTSSCGLCSRRYDERFILTLKSVA